MMFQAQTYKPGDFQYEVLVLLIASVIIISTLGVFFLLVFEIFRSLRYARFMLKMRDAEIELQNLEHHMIDRKAKKKKGEGCLARPHA